jgi:hypothetical protein
MATVEHRSLQRALAVIMMLVFRTLSYCHGNGNSRGCSIHVPKPTPSSVPIALPSVPTNSAGSTSEFQPFAAAIAEAVAALPTAAFDATSASFSVTPGTLEPMPTATVRCTAYMIKPNSSSGSAWPLLRAADTVPLLAPTLAKNRNSSCLPIFSPLAMMLCAVRVQ